jgi:drug/metabolite transporter (DMT)-like permease
LDIQHRSDRAYKGLFFLLMAAAFWGMAAPVGKYLIVHRFDTLTIAQTRTSLAFVLLAIYFAAKDRNLFRVRSKDLWKLAALGVVGLATTNFTYYFTIKESTVATAILVQYSAPVWVLLYSVWIAKVDTLDWTTILALVVALAGCYFAVTSGSLQTISLKGWALLTGPLSAFTFAYQVIATRRMVKRYSVWTVLLYMFGFATVFWLFINPPWNFFERHHYQATDWGLLWLFAVISILIPQAAFASGLKFVEASKAGIISILEPVFAIGAAFLILDESLNAIQIIGGGMVLGAVALLQIQPILIENSKTH